LIPFALDDVEDNDYHNLMADLYKEQLKRSPRTPRPEGVGESEWKNRHLISAKLPEGLYADLMAFCRAHGFSVNTGLKVILTKHFNNA